MKECTIMDRILAALSCKNDQALLAELNKIDTIHQPQVSRWRKNGFPKSTEILIERLLMEIDSLKEPENAK